MRNVLFVDDEANVLRGLRRMLRDMRHEWHMEFAEGGKDALVRLDERVFDVVVSDMRMPGMDGAELLAEVKRRSPRTVRIVLSGFSEQEAVLKCVGSTHQYLSKPCDPEVLRRTIQRADELQSLLTRPSVLALAGRLSSIPSFPSVYREVVEELQKPSSSLETVGEIVEQDIGMSSKLLQIVNSSYFGLRRPMSSARRAVSHLGIETTTALILNAGLFEGIEESALPGFSTEELWHHSIQTATYTRAIVEAGCVDAAIGDDAFMAGILHDAGKLMLSVNLPDDYGEVIRRVEREQRRVSAVEREVLGATHAEVAAYVFGLWGLPDSIVEAIAYHADPSTCPRREVGTLAVVHVASALAWESSRAAGRGMLDETYLEELSLTEKLDEWRRACRAETGE